MNSVEKFQLAQEVADSDAVLREAYAAVEWDSLDDDGKQWIAAIVGEAFNLGAARHREAARFLLWQYDRKGPLAESHEAWEQLREALTKPAGRECTCGGDPDQPTDHHDLSCPLTIPAPDAFAGLERDQLREALAIYGDRSAMGTVEPQYLQQAIDDALSWANERGIRPRGDVARKIMAEMGMDTAALSDRDDTRALEQFRIDEREDDMLIAEPHWQHGWRCIARRPKLATNEEWRPDAERIVAALSAHRGQPASVELHERRPACEGADCGEPRSTI